MVLPFLPDGGPRELYDRTLGYQASRSSPFSVWGLAPSLEFLRPLARAGAIALALAVALWPRRKTPAQVAALAAAVLIAVQLGATHWFYFYVVWFLPLVLAALFVAQRGEGLSDRRPKPPQGRRADHRWPTSIRRLPSGDGLGVDRRPRGSPGMSYIENTWLAYACDRAVERDRVEAGLKRSRLTTASSTRIR